MSVTTVWLEDGQGHKWPIRATCSIGRSSTNDIVIDDGRVSRRHALVHKQDDAEYWVIDLGSGNGTYLNGRRLIQPTRLADGDTLTVHDRVFSFRRIAAGSAVHQTRISAQTIINVRSFDCWLVVADIMGSTAMAASLTPTEMAMQVGRWMGACKEVVDSHGGAINKFLGDGFFAFWLAEEVADDRIVAALQALRTIQGDKAGPKFRFVMHYGTVAFGGGGSLGEDSLSGADVVVAFRMEKIASGLGCNLMVSDEVRQRLDGPLAFRDLGTHAVPGFDGAGRRFYAVR